MMITDDEMEKKIFLAGTAFTQNRKKSNVQ